MCLDFCRWIPAAKGDSELLQVGDDLLSLTNQWGRITRLDEASVIRYVQSLTGENPGSPDSSWSRSRKSQFGEDLVGGWLMENDGFLEGLAYRTSIEIPEGGNASERRVDWLVGGKKVVEVKTYDTTLVQGPDAFNTRQIADLARWRDQEPTLRKVVLARVSWNGHSKIHPTFRADLRHYRIPVHYFLW